MINFITRAWGIVVLLLALICLFPMLGWGNWFVIVLAIIGIIISAFTEKRGGMTLNIVALILAFFRLLIGGGVI